LRTNTGQGMSRLLHSLDLNVAASRYYYLYEYDMIHQVRETNPRIVFLMFIAEALLKSGR
jgi:hypothetical protein